MNRRFIRIASVAIVGVVIGLGLGLGGFLVGLRTATLKWRRQLPELGKVIARKNAGETLELRHWPADIQLCPADVQGDRLTVYMGFVADTKVDLVFEEGRLVAIRARE